MSKGLFQALFAPRVVALVGASGEAGKNTARPQRFLAGIGYTGTVVPINPGRSEIDGVPAYPSLAAAHAAFGKIDHAYVMAPGEAVERAVADCGACGIPVASIFSDGFSELGPGGAARQARLLAAARKGGVRLLGPNSMGVVDVPGKVAITVNAVLEGGAPPIGGTSVISQSGTMLGTLMSRGAARGLGFAKLVSVGNEADLGIGELLDLLVDDADTRVIALFLETVRDAPRLARAARRAHAAGKPVVAYKLGRSDLGEAMARSHTGALAGTDAAVDAFLRDCGIVRVDMLETLIEIAPLLAGRAPPALSRTPRVAVVTTTGGGAASVVDRLGVLGMQAMAASPALKAELEGHGVRVADSPIVDLTMAGSGKRYAAVLDALMATPDCDAVLAVVGSSAQFHPEVAVEPILRTKTGPKPLAAFLTPQADRSLTLLAQKAIPAFRTPEACADALSGFFRWTAPREPVAGDPAPAGAVLPAHGRPDEADALALFASLGVPVVAGATAAAPDFAHAVAYPVAAKVRSPDIAHKTDAGGVLLNIGNAAEFAARVPDMLAAVAMAHPRARIAGVLVQRMEKGLAEVIVGYRHDPMVGPVVMVGAGGTLAEIYKDYAVRLAPVSQAEASAMIAAVRGLAVIRGYRNLPPGDVAALARAVAAFSRLACLPGQPVVEAEINPLLVKREGVVAVDGLVVLGRSGERDRQ
jgi:acyl-CoA synthetase (NDP forming)